jgi:hypothetical protein
MSEKKFDPEMRVRQAPAFGDLGIDASEKDSILLWQKQGDESNVIFIDRTKLKEVIEILSGQLNADTTE